MKNFPSEVGRSPSLSSGPPRLEPRVSGVASVSDNTVSQTRCSGSGGRPTSEGKLVKPQPEPRYDDVFYEGLDWLDTL